MGMWHKIRTALSALELAMAEPAGPYAVYMDLHKDTFM